MKIDRAVEILSESANMGLTTFNADYRAAQLLGIEALKKVRESRELFVLSPELLEGETKE